MCCDGPRNNYFVSFCFCSQNFNKRAVSSVSGSQEEESCELCITGSLPSSSFASGQQWVAQERPSCPFVEPGKGCNTWVPASCRHTPGCHKPQAGFLNFLPQKEESGECYTSHPDPAPCHHKPWAGSLCSTMLPHHGYVCVPVGSAGTVSQSLASAPQSVPVAPAVHQTWLCDSVCPASPQVQGHPVHFSQGRRCPCLAGGNHSPAGEGCDRAGPSSRYEVGVLQPLLHCAQEKRWVTTNLGSASFELCASQAAVQDVDAETHFRVHPSPRLVCSDRPEGRVLSCFDPPVTRVIPAIRVPYQYKFLPFGLSPSPCIFTKVAEVALVPLRERGCASSTILTTGSYSHSLAISCDLVLRDLVLRHLSQLGLQVNWEKSKLVPMQMISFLGMELDSVNQTARLTQEHAQSVLNCLKTLSGRMAVPLKFFQRLLGLWNNLLWAGVPLEQVSRHAVVFTDASATSWGATYSGHAVSGVWTGPQLHWHINCANMHFPPVSLLAQTLCKIREDEEQVRHCARSGRTRSRSC